MTDDKYNHDVITCPDCGLSIIWYDIILTGQPGQPNYIEGDCPCSEWEDRDAGGEWVCYSREASPPDGESHEWERVTQ